MNIYRISKEGKKYSQAIYKKGDYFGELEVFSMKPYVCSVETITEARVWRIPRRPFLRWVELNKNFLLYLINTLCDSFYRLSKKAGEDTLYPRKYRICNFALVLSGGLGDRSFYDSSHEGFERAKKELGIEGNVLECKNDPSLFQDQLV